VLPTTQSQQVGCHEIMMIVCITVSLNRVCTELYRILSFFVLLQKHTILLTRRERARAS
jgi:hypothetical protein